MMRDALSEQNPLLIVTVYVPTPLMVLVVPVLLPPGPVQLNWVPGALGLLASLAVKKEEPSAHVTTVILASGLACTVTVEVAVLVCVPPL